MATKTNKQNNEEKKNVTTIISTIGNFEITDKVKCLAYADGVHLNEIATPEGKALHVAKIAWLSCQGKDGEYKRTCLIDDNGTVYSTASPSFADSLSRILDMLNAADYDFVENGGVKLGIYMVKSAKNPAYSYLTCKL